MPALATAALVAAGDEAAISLDRARRAGVYPADYRYRACPVDSVLQEDEPLRIGDMHDPPDRHPGHARDHVSYLVETPSRTMLLAGDALFHGGKVAIQDIVDCDIAATCATIRRLATLDFDALLPGHLAFSLNNGRRHADAALGYVDRLLCPPSII